MEKTIKPKVKKVVEKAEKSEKAAKPAVKKISPEKKEKYFEAVGRRKTAVARVRLYTKKDGIIVNGKNYTDYFPLLRWQKEIVAPIEKMKINDKLGATIIVKGSGVSAQAIAVRHGISRALVKFNAEFKKRLRKAGYLLRDPRAVERKKYGRHKARRGHQWRKR
ncbi:30S ribosomal protein S9 [Candidatus Wolfebacteria bacterium]|nr:30S ribosomal protein S9 [Candidatus Wolfebacteria bacterium]